ncbi:MAG: ATP synthase F1 subunit delta [Candidatus Tumulicola sp.]
MVNEKLARRYALAVFSVANDAGKAVAVGDDLAAVASAIDTNPAARDFFAAPVVDRRAKASVLVATFESRVSDIALHTLLLLVRKRRETLLPGLVAEYRKLQRTARGEEALTVTSARAMPDAELDALVARLEQVFGKKFDVTRVVDPRTIGGVRVLMGDRRIDGTVAGRLENLARNLFAPSGL